MVRWFNQGSEYCASCGTVFISGTVDTGTGIISGIVSDLSDVY